MQLRIRSLALAVALAASGGVAAQDFAFGWNPRSGDVWVDTYLNDINDYGYRYREPFVDELVRYHDAPRDLVTELLIDRRWARPIELDNDLVRIYPDRRRVTIADRDLRMDADGRGNDKAKGNNKAGGNDRAKGNGRGNADKGGKPAHAGKDKGKPDHAGGGKDKGGQGKSGDKGKGKGKS